MAAANAHERVYNFSPGPAMLPLSVLERARDEMVALPGVGASVLEISHRGPAFVEIIEAAEANLRKLLSIPDEYAVLFLQGGSRLQFSMVPMNLSGDKKSADYVLTGSWGKKAAAEAKKVGEVRTAYSAAETGFDRVPAEGDIDFDPDAAFVHYCCNETIQGVQFAGEPTPPEGVPLVCDASSDLLHRPLDISRYGLIYACAQKNCGPAGVTIVIIRKDLAERAPDDLGVYLNYKMHIEEKSLGNTPPCFSIYINKLVTDWLIDEVGGLDKMFDLNKQKALLLYDVLDASPDFYRGHAQPESRSVMNVTFRLPSDELTTDFVAGAATRGLSDLKGHRSVGGVRASIYNAMPLEGVVALRDYMVAFRDEHAS